MERLMSGIGLPMQERSIVSDTLLPSRNVGVVWSGTAFEQNTSWAVGAFNDWLVTGDDFNQSASQLVGRVTWVPWASEDESNLVHLGAGLRYSNAQEGTRYRGEPEVSEPIFVDTGKLAADDSLTWNLEASWRKGPFWLAAEYTRADVDTLMYGPASFDGWHLTASWALTGEMRDYNRRNGTFGPIRIARSGLVGGPGSWEATLRYSHIDLNDSGISGGESDILSAGLNWWPHDDLGFSINYRYIQADRLGVKGDSHLINTRLIYLID